jgi:hypothetical protein
MKELPAAGRPPSASKWRVKYDGVCSNCGIQLRAGAVAVYERSTRSIHCVQCPAEAAASRPLEGSKPIDTGVAGASALREYERRKASREVRVKGRLGDRLGGIVLAVTSEPRSTRAWATGAHGEEKLAKALAGMDELRVLHDRRVRATKGNIDHIVVAPAGIFVVDAKKYEGLIEIRNRGGFFKSDYRLYVGRRDCAELADKLGWQVAAVETALREGGVDPLPPLTPVLCFVDGEWPLISPPDTFRGVRLEGTRSIRKLLTVPVALDASAIDHLAQILARRLPAK